MSKNQEKGILFRSSVNGFNKADVNKYIQDENIRFAALESEYSEKIQGLQCELDLAKAEIERLSKHYEAYLALRKEAEELRESLDSANSQIKEKQDEIAALKEKIAVLSVEAQSASTTNDEAYQKNLVLLSENADLRDRIAELEAIISENSNASSGMTDEEKNEFGDMLLRAKYASEDMLKRAEEGAGIIIDRAKDEIFTRRNEAFKAAKEIFNAATEELRRSIGICMNDFAAAIRKSKNDPARTSEAADICDDDLSRRIERMQNDLDRAIAEKLAEFDNKK